MIKLLHSIPEGSKIWIIGDEYTRDDPGVFESKNGNLAKVALSAASSNSIGFVEFRKDSYVDITSIEEIYDEDGNTLIDLIRLHNPEGVIVHGRTLAAAISPTLCKKKTTANLNKYPLLSVPELPCKIAVTYHLGTLYKEVAEDSTVLTSLTKRYEGILFGDKESKYKVDWSFVDYNGLVDFLTGIREIGYKDLIGLDYESNGAELFSSDIKLTGFSVAIKSSPTNAISVWYQTDNDESEEQMSFIRDFFREYQEQIIAFNCPYEIKASWGWLGEFFRFKDAIVTITMHGERSSLKDACRKFLNVDFWEGDTHEWIDRFKSYFKRMSKCDPELIKQVQDKSYNYYDQMAKKTAYLDLVSQAPTRAAANHIPKDFDDTILSIVEELSAELDIDQSLYLMSYYPYEWGAVPRDILGEYCCYDSAYTIFLQDYFKGQYDSGYDVYMLHPYLASVFEGNGIVWDDEQATREYYYCQEKMVESIKKLLPHLDIPMEEKLQVNDYINRQLPYTNVWYTPSGQERRAVIDTTEKYLNDLTSFFNPNSNTNENRAKFWNAYLTDEIRLGTMLYAVIDCLHEADCWDKVLLSISKGFEPKNPDKYEKEFMLSKPPADILGLIIAVGNDHDDGDLRIKIACAVNEGVDNYESRFTGTFSGPVTDAQLKIHTGILGVNSEDPSTWSKEFSMLVALKMYKRHYKSISTYINGKNGRQAVWASKLREGLPPLRLRPYDWEHPELNEGEVYIYTPSFNSLAAVTSRWSSGYHVVPGTGSVRKIWKGRRKGSVWAHIDYSQAELVMVSAFSGDKEMQNVFLSGGDMHRFVSSVAYQKPESEISPLERGAGKAINFALVYQSSIESVAMAATNGDIERAQQLIDTVFGRFGGLKKWIDENKAIGFETGYVHGYFGNRISLEGSNVNSTSVNYPIQNTSSMVAGAGMFFLDEDFKQSKLDAYSHGFVHDSDDISFNIDDLITVYRKAKDNMETAVRGLWGMPMRVDFEFGVDAGELLGLEEIEEIDNGYVIHVEGARTSLDSLMTLINTESKWTGTCEVTKSKTVRNPISDSFNQKSGVNSVRPWGSEYEKVSAKIFLAA